MDALPMSYLTIRQLLILSRNFNGLEEIPIFLRRQEYFFIIISSNYLMIFFSSFERNKFLTKNIFLIFLFERSV